MAEDIRPFTIDIPEADLDDLRDRLARTRWPDAEVVDDWSQGIPLTYMQELCRYWADDYDWRRCEVMLNQFSQYTTAIDGVDIHFIHQRSPHETAQPLIISHGWPGSVVEFHKVIDPLTNPTAHGGDEADAFHVVAPSLPGYGFSGRPAEPGWTVNRFADVWVTLMARLGYQRFMAQGGDWGSMVTMALGAKHADAVEAIHTNMPITIPDPVDDMSDLEASALASMDHYQREGSGYSKQQSTRPQTLGYGLADSAAGQCAWIVEKFYEWTDCDGHPENVLHRDELLDNVMLYWLTNTATSSARLYWESFTDIDLSPINVPSGVSVFPKEIFRASERWVKNRFTDLRHYNALDKGGHFAAFEQPELYVAELRAWKSAVA